MIDFTKYNLDEDDKYIIDVIYGNTESQTNLGLCYKHEKHFDIDNYCDKVHVFMNNNEVGTFNDVDELLLNFKIDGKPLIEVVKYLDIV